MARMSWRGRQKEGSQTVPSLANLRQEMDRLMDTYIREPLGLEWPFGQRGWAPPVDMAESNEEVIFRCEIPGIDPNELEVTVSGGQLVLTGEKKEPPEASAWDFHQRESRGGRFRRALALNQAVDLDRIEADHTNGVLTIRLKKIPAMEPKRIQVRTRTSEPSLTEIPGAEPPASPPGFGGEV